LAFGDSLTAGAGIAAEDSLPAQLKRRLSADGFDVEVVQGGVSGDTTTTGLARLDYMLGAGPFDIAIVELGANDMLNGHDPRATRANLDQILTVLQQKGVRPILTAMVSSANHGQAYKRDFDSVYPDLAAKHQAPLVPFILEGVWGSPALLIADSIHPNAVGVAKIVKRLAPYVEKTLVSMGATKSSRAQ
jgi:acyl-CoA thioesterase-1